MSAPRAGNWVGAILGLAAFVLFLPGLGEVGVTWDEPRYFESVERIQGWTARVAAGELDALAPGAIRAAWDADRYYNPHPPFYKEGMALTDALFGGRVGVPAGYRMFSLATFALLAGLLTAWTARAAGLPAGVAAGATLLLMPRVVGHAHVAATDMPLTLLWFASTLAFVFHFETGRRRWLVAGGIALGLALATKFTAFLLPVPLAAWMLLRARRGRAFGGLLLGGALALLVAVLVNPAAWPDPVGYQARLFEESLARESTTPITTYFAHRAYEYVVPWTHAVLMTLYTLPLPVAALAFLGLVAGAARRPTRGIALLCGVQVVFWWTLLGLPGSPNHDGVRLWLPMFPFVAVAAGLGFALLVRAARRWYSGPAATVAVSLLAVAYLFPAALGTLRASPYFLSYYGEAIGGLSGAERRGMEVTYWYDAVTTGFRARLDEFLPPGARVVAYPNPEYYEQLQTLGLIRDDLRFVAAPPADYLLLLARKAMFNPGWHEVYGSVPPLLAVESEGVELVGLYAWDADALPALDDATVEEP